MQQRTERSLGWSVGPRGDVYFLDKKWTTVGLAIFFFLLLQIITGTIEFILAALFDHGYGVLVGLLSYSVALAGLIAILNSNFFAKLKRWWRLLVWIPNVTLLLYLVILLSIRWAAPDHPVKAFPSSCHRTTNCCRLTLNGTTIAPDSQADGLTVPVLATTLDATSILIEDWVSGFSNAGYIRRAYNGSLYQVRFVSNAFGFPDDFYVNYTCIDSSVVLAIQSESRLGTGDFGVNRDRVMAFLTYLSRATITPGTCT